MGTVALVVEDDVTVRWSLRMLLEDEGFEVVEAADGRTGLDAFERSPVELALVDLKLPDISGFEVCRRLRVASGVPIVVVTAQVDSYDVVAGLEAGADDYVTKPFEPKVLAARIRALLRRSQAGAEVPERFELHGGVTVSPAEGVVTKRGEEVHLTKTEFRLLCELALHRGQVLSRDQLLERVWGYEYPGDGRLVDSHIRRLRLKVEDVTSDPINILTVRGLGYKLAP